VAVAVPIRRHTPGGAPVRPGSAEVAQIGERYGIEREAAAPRLRSQLAGARQRKQQNAHHEQRPVASHPRFFLSVDSIRRSVAARRFRRGH